MPVPERTVLQLTQKEFGDWLDLHGRRLYADFYAQVRTDVEAILRRQDARWQSLNARVTELTAAVSALAAGRPANTEPNRVLEDIAGALYVIQRELQSQRAAHRDPFSVFAALLRDVRPEGLRAGHAIWPPRAVDEYLRATWRLTDPEIRRYKTVWRDARLIAVERENFARKFTVERGVVAYRFAVPVATFDLFRIDGPPAEHAEGGRGDVAAVAGGQTSKPPPSKREARTEPARS